MTDAIYAPRATGIDPQPAGKDRLHLDLDFDGRVLGAPARRVESSGTGALTLDALLGDETVVVGQYASDLFLADDALSARALVHRALRGRATAPAILRLCGRGTGGITVHVAATPSHEGARLQIRSCEPAELRTLRAGANERARFDALTGLPRLRLMLEQVRSSPEASARALGLIDLDGFHELLTALGPRAADAVIIEIGDRLVAAVGDSGVVGLSGQRFAVLFESRPVPVMTRSLITQIHAVIAEPMTARGGTIELSACLGFAFSTDVDALIVDAEIALAHAKSLGPGRDAIFDPTFRNRALHQATLQTDLARAVSHDELRLDFQPIVALETAAIVGYEALVRWQHPVRGRLAPRDFLWIAQRSRAGAAIDDWVMMEACRQAAGWSRPGPAATVCVNVAPERFAAPGFVERLVRALDTTGLDAARLVLEITEWGVLVDVDAARHALDALRALGVRVALDDYGTGYSSLSHVAALPVDELKIDISFVAGLGSDRARTAIVRAIVALGNALDITVVAEGVESSDQACALRALGCEYGQGFHFGRPTPEAALVSSPSARTP
jgi:predicted signal transduction protein with EAL and GGDEF domain